MSWIDAFCLPHNAPCAHRAESMYALAVFCFPTYPCTNCFAQPSGAKQPFRDPSSRLVDRGTPTRPKDADRVSQREPPTLSTFTLRLLLWGRLLSSMVFPPPCAFRRCPTHLTFLLLPGFLVRRHGAGFLALSNVCQVHRWDSNHSQRFRVPSPWGRAMPLRKSFYS